MQQPPQNVSSDDITWGVLCHVSSISGLIGIPFGNILGPLIIWLIKRKHSEFVDFHGKESLNFQISVTLYSLLPFLVFIAPSLLGAEPFVAISISTFLLLVITFVVAILILTIIATVKAGKGKRYRYQLSIRFIR